MRRIFFPPMKGYLIIESPIPLAYCCNISTKEPPAPFSGILLASVPWKLEPGEWWPIAGIYYPRSGNSYRSNYLPTIRLNIHRSKKGRKWVKGKIAKMAMEHLGTSDYYCYERTILCKAAEINDKVVLAPDQATALIYSKRILGQCKTQKNSRFSSLLLEQ